MDVGRIAADSVTADPGTFIGTIMVRSRENHMTLHSSICGVVCRNLIQSHACECVLFRRTMKISLEQNEVLRRQMLHWPGKPTAICVHLKKFGQAAIEKKKHSDEQICPKLCSIVIVHGL